jgi:predicted ribosome quality control (RQC) complex YloA/Tae2 family protein
MNPPLNWREIETLANWIRPEIVGMFVDRIIVPERPEFPDGFLKNEWSLRLTSRRQEAALIFSVRPRQPYLDWVSGKGPKASPHATRSGFDLGLNKRLEGRKVLGFEAIERERTAVLWIEGEPAKGEEEATVFGLVVTLIPALPEALLIEAPKKALEGKGRLARHLHSEKLRILARSRNDAETEYLPPDGARSPADLRLRAEGFGSLSEYQSLIRETIDEEAFEIRLQRLRTRVNQDLKQARTRMAQNERTLLEARDEPDYRHLGDLLKSVMSAPPPLEGKKRKVYDWLLEEEIEIECDPKLSVKDQVEKFYSLAKRKERRISEAELRIETFREKADRLAKVRADTDRIALSKLRGRAKIDELAPFEAKLGIVAGSPEIAERRALAGKAGKQGWSGKTFVSKEGLPILVGRSKDENLELTFKFARGNDLWMHVRGKPGAHVLIPLRSKKSASLETLLDAAFLCLHYSGGAEWGKTEVDYAFKKYVKRIRDSTEASYVNNKTLIVEVDAKRLKDLLSQENL